MADDDDRSRDSQSAAGAGRSDPAGPDTWWATTTAPDDISELARDIQAYHRERRAARRREVGRRLGLRPGATPFSLTVAVLALVAIATTLLMLMGPTTSGPGPAALRLAAPPQPVGQHGGLVPAVTLSSRDGQPVPSRSLRPGAMVLLPTRCTNCNALVTSLDQAAADAAHLPLFVVAPTGYPSATADTLPGQLRVAGDVLYDPTAAMRSGVHAHGLTLVLVGRDGRIYDIKNNVTSADGVSADLLNMLASYESTA